MTITQLIQSSPANANELFTKLAATGNGAVKTREGLFAELKAELELHSRLEEEHLFPALRKHKETKDLVRLAVEDNKQARTLLAELEGVRKDNDEFLVKVASLQKSFQQHVRDEKKELLPAVKTALSAEESQAIADKVQAERQAHEAAKQKKAEELRAVARVSRERAEAKKAAAAEAKRKETSERRAAARLEREKLERREAQAQARRQRALEEEKRQQAEMRAEERRVRAEQALERKEAEAARRAAQETGEALANAGESLVLSSQAVLANGGAAAQAAGQAGMADSQRFAAGVVDALGISGAAIANVMQSYSERAEPAMEGLQRLVALPTAAASVAAEAGKTWCDLMNRTAESRGRRTMQLVRSVTPHQTVIAQTRYFSEAVQAWTEANARLVDISIEAYRGLLAPIDGKLEGGRSGGPKA